MGVDSEDNDEKVVSIFDGNHKHRRNSKFSGSLKSSDPEFQSLIEYYMIKVNGSTPNDHRSKNEIGIAIMKYDTIDHMDLLIKFAILEIALGYGSTSPNHHMIHENLMCIYFKRSMIECMENTLSFAD